MPTLFSNGITISADVAQRIQAATGVSSVAEAEAWIKQLVKNHVVNYEVEQTVEAEREKIDQANESRRTAIDTAMQTAETEIQLT